MIDIFLICGQLYPFAEVVLLTTMEYLREGDGSGLKEDSPCSQVEEQKRKRKDKLNWLAVTGRARNIW